MSALAAAVRYRALVDRLGAIVWEAIPGRRPGEATFTFVSEGTEALLGYTPERWMADRTFWYEMIHPEDRERVNGEIAAAAMARRNADFEYRALAADGRLVWLRNIVQIDANADELRMTGVLVDITERHLADARLVRLQELTDALSALLTPTEVAEVVATRSRAAVGAVAAAVFLRDGDELEMAGYDGHASELPHVVCRIPLDRDTPAAEAVRTGNEIVLDNAGLAERYPDLGEWRKLAGDGRFVALPLDSGDRILGSIALRLAGDQPLGAADHVVLEVLERTTVSALLRAEQAAAERASRAVLDTVITSAPEGFALFDAAGRYVRVNEALAKINGVPVEDHAGRTHAEIVPEISAAGVAEPLRQVLETGEPVVDLEVTGQTAAAPGVTRTWLATYYPVRDELGQTSLVGAFVVDITERKRAEERARLFGELGTFLNSLPGVEERMDRLVEALVPAVCTAASVSLRGADGTLEPVASRGTAEAELTVPLLVRGRDLGTLALSFAHPAIDGEDGTFAAEVARRAALAVDTARLFDAERVARERTSRQYRVAAALAEALTAADVARATLAEIIPAVGAESGTMWQVSEDGTVVEAIGWHGFTDEEMRGYERAAITDPRPVADTIRSGKLMWLPDAESFDSRYPQFAAGMRAQGLESVAVFPLTVPGRVVGGLLLSASRPHALSQDDLALGTALAAQAGQALERARLYEAERRVSVTLQRSLLPIELPELAGVEIALRYLPAAGLEAGGDFYEAVTLPDGSLLVAVGDVVGRGATAAAAMGQLRSALRAYALTGESPGEILEKLSAFADTVPEAMAATAVVAKLDPVTGRLCFACAGHPWPLLTGPGGAEFLEGGRGVPLGCLPEPSFPEAVVDLAPGATLLLYTDGLTERRGQDMDAVLERIRTGAEADADEPLETVLDGAVSAAGDVAPADDVALVALRFTGAVSVLRLDFEAVTASVPVARHAIRDWLAGIGVGGLAAADLLLASGEAVANAVEHSGTERVEVELSTPTAHSVAILVRDSGHWKDPVVSHHRGRGFGLMRTLTDECAVQRSATGTVVRLLSHVGIGTAPAPGPEAPVACSVDLGDGTAVLSGDLDIESADRVRQSLLGGDLEVVDLSAVTYLDSSGARMLFELPTRPAFIAPPGSPSRRTLDLSALSGVMDVRDA